MSAVERMEAAVAKLELLRSEGGDEFAAALARTVDAQVEILTAQVAWHASFYGSMALTGKVPAERLADAILGGEGVSAPSTGAVRNAYLANSIQTGSTAEVEQLGGGFDRWLAGVEREAAAKALESAADALWQEAIGEEALNVVGDLRARAEEYREGKR